MRLIWTVLFCIQSANVGANSCKLTLVPGESLGDLKIGSLAPKGNSKFFPINHHSCDGKIADLSYRFGSKNSSCVKVLGNVFSGTTQAKKVFQVIKGCRLEVVGMKPVFVCAKDKLGFRFDSKGNLASVMTSSHVFRNRFVLDGRVFRAQKNRCGKFLPEVSPKKSNVRKNITAIRVPSYCNDEKEDGLNKAYCQGFARGLKDLIGKYPSEKFLSQYAGDIENACQSVDLTNSQICSGYLGGVHAVFSVAAIGNANDICLENATTLKMKKAFLTVKAPSSVKKPRALLAFQEEFPCSEDRKEVLRQKEWQTWSKFFLSNCERQRKEKNLTRSAVARICECSFRIVSSTSKPIDLRMSELPGQLGATLKKKRSILITLLEQARNGKEFYDLEGVYIRSLNDCGPAAFLSRVTK